MTSPEPELDTTATDAAGVDVESTVEGTVDPASGSEEATGANSAEVAELTAALQRERAQFANYKRRTEEEKQGRVAYGKQILIDKLLPVLDDLDRAREHGDLESGPLKGVADKLIATLDAEGLTKFGAPGDPFDPELHEAVQNDGSGTEPVIGAVYRGGYRLGDKVIRTAMVTVTDPAPAGQSQPQDTQSGAQ
ncbi:MULTISPECIES: nucleotide exchange factor GrpE [Gordonia]|uniref:Protein GrpE n=1 Tax=Gordonia sputi NBRC 100414 TaxID=1089453 RepID=H5TV11_9ACTN|nr:MULTISPECIES: nucleotide exchange factor GrpE [Gordonia]OBA34243.1 nucleotide exchange factor GrpE [Gordonia sp. 852002-51296_SCH5728562-b]GAB37319.1 protein GrpE [Gordonia sputi NBRC 100414]